MLKIEIATWWLKQGANLAPGQRDSKMLAKGFGPHQGKIRTTGEASLFWGSEASRANMIVIAWDGLIILDFDKADLYTAWARDHPNESGSYTEQSPRPGYHVFMRGLVPHGLDLLEGVEIKNLCVVAPSVVNGKQYTRGHGEILNVDSTVALTGLTKPGTLTAYAYFARNRLFENHHLEKTQDQKTENLKYPGSTVSRIKQAYTVTEVFIAAKPDSPLQGHGRYITARCPFHDDRNPSFWLDQELNIFGCHGCKVAGDVINLYAKLHGITNQEAITRMARGLS